MQAHFKKRISAFVVIVLGLVWLLFSTANFLFSLNNIQNNEVGRRFEEIAKVNASEIRLSVQKYFSILSSSVVFIERSNNIVSDEVISEMGSIAAQHGFSRMSIDFADGTAFTSDGHAISIAKFNYGDKIRLGKPFVLDVLDAVVDDVPGVSFIVPIRHHDGTYRAALRGTVSTANLANVLYQGEHEQDWHFYVVDGNGKYLAKSDEEKPNSIDASSYFDTLRYATFEKDYSAAHIQALFENKKSDVVKYRYKGQENTFYFVPAEINNWMIMVVVPEDAIDASSQQQGISVAIFVAQLVVICALFIYYIYTTQKNEKEKALLNEKCFRALSEQTGKVIFDWNFAENRITSMSNFEALFGRKAVTVNEAEDALLAKAVHEEDKAVFENVFRTILNGNPVDDVRFRVMNNHGVYYWCSLSGLVIKNQEGKPFKAIGALECIEDKINKENELRQKAEHDHLTGFYNKATTEILVKTVLADRRYTHSKHALMIIDVDNFKSVNDKLGHLFGDGVLAEVAGTLRSIFRSSDIVGRVGGDEFLIMLVDYQDSTMLMQKAQKICDSCRKKYTSGQSSAQISASVGIALFPQHGRDYNSLFAKADVALYDTKAKGKDDFTFYYGQECPAHESSHEPDSALLAVEK